MNQFVTAPITNAKADWLVIYEGGTTDSFEFAYAYEEVMAVPARLSITEKWQHNVLNPEASADVDDLSETVDAVYEGIDIFGPSFISLAHLDPRSVQGEHLAATLRATFPWRHEVTGWDEALEVAREALGYAGADPDDALYGLVDN
ncbi:hypothetical protein [Paraburkholderia sp. J63]|uniref:hypothetical protein n=1 Tax=Paraburkholderia sp. J63 TaxID=2805434 RepID=UPI002ABD89DE|nr:hypothetical protein [Paraburkholderia sp. J63]